jgi:hypothetical protein
MHIFCRRLCGRGPEPARPPARAGPARRLQLPVAMTGLEFMMAARAFPGERLPLSTLPGATLEIGRRIVNRELVDVVAAGARFAPGEQVYAHSDVGGAGAGFIEHVWTHDGVEVARHYMPIGEDRRWRTWSRHKLEVGAYTVELFGPDGKRMAVRNFFVGSLVTPLPR